MNVCCYHLGSTISQHSDRESSRCPAACLSLRHLLSIAVQGRSLHSGLSLCVGFFPRRIFAYCRRISVADFAADFPFDLSTSRCGFLRRICSGPKPCKLHVKIAPKIHHKNPTHSSPHARLVCDYTLPAFFTALFTACFAACPSTGILHYFTYTADFFRGGFLLRLISSAANFCELCRHTTLTFVHGCCTASSGHLSLHIRRDWGHMWIRYPIGYAAMVVFQMSLHLASVLCHV